MSDRKPPKFSVYDPAKDGNRFEWIIKQAAVLPQPARKGKGASRPLVTSTDTRGTVPRTAEHRTGIAASPTAAAATSFLLLFLWPG